MNRTCQRAIAPLILTATLAGAGYAAPISFVFTWNAVNGGTLGGSAFGVSDLRFTGIADTDDINVVSASFETLDLEDAVLEIVGFATVEILDAQQVFFNEVGDVIGLRQVGGGNVVSATEPDLAGYGLNTAVGPLPDSYSFSGWDDISTSSGSLTMPGGVSPGTFEAIAGAVTLPSISAPIPLPAGGMLMGGALVGCMALFRRRGNPT
ncbi:MAG: hypothetical protein AAGF71_09070 [Pseudomonadota bacterium]